MAKKLIAIIKPKPTPKPWDQMTAAEQQAHAEAGADKVADALRAAGITVTD